MRKHTQIKYSYNVYKNHLKCPEKRCLLVQKNMLVGECLLVKKNMLGGCLLVEKYSLKGGGGFAGKQKFGTLEKQLQLLIRCPIQDGHLMCLCGFHFRFCFPSQSKAYISKSAHRKNFKLLLD